MPTKRVRINRLFESELSPGQQAFLLGEPRPDTAGIVSFLHWSWLWRETGKASPDMPDRSPGRPSVCQAAIWV
jgi:hypothetical protein